METSRPTARAHGSCTAQEEGVNGGSLDRPSVNHLIGCAHGLMHVVSWDLCMTVLEFPPPAVGALNLSGKLPACFQEGRNSG